MTQLQLTSHSPRRGSAAAAGNSAESTRDTYLPSTEPAESHFVFSGSDSSASRVEFRFRTPSFSVSISSPDDREPATPNFTWSPSGDGVGQPADTAVGNMAINLDRLQIADQTPPRFSHSTPNTRSNSQNRMSEEPEMVITSQARERGSQLNGPFTPRSRRSSTGNVEPGYKVHEEDAPEDAFNAAGFQSALAETKCLVQELESTLTSSSLHLEHSSAMHKLHAKAARLASSQLASTRKLGFVGDAGAGKSSVINSLLDIKGLIRTSNGVTACTRVATEFHFHELPTFHIEVELLDEAELLDQLVQLLHSYRQFHFKEFDTSIEAEQSDVGKRARLAQDTFNFMFLGRVPSQQFLLRQPEDKAKRRFQDLLQDLRPSSASLNKFGLSRETCAQELRLLSSSVTSSDERFAWPFIRRIKVSLNAHILSKGLVLVDLPGLRDLNSARRNITERYLRECDYIFAVYSISRVTSDRSVQDVLNEARQLPNTNIGIICTRSEDICNDEALYDWQYARGQHVQAMQDNVDHDKAELKDLKDRKKEVKEASDDKYELTSEESRELRDIRRRSRQVEERLETNKFRLQSFLIHSRNKHVSDKLEENYAQCVPEGKLNVFCVSNRIYKEKRDLPKSEAQGHLQLSGIPALRRFCISVVSESQYRSASQCEIVKVPAVIEAVALWLQSGSDTVDAERKQDIIDKLDEMERRLTSSLLQRTSPVHKLSAQLQRYFQTQICDRQHVPSWSAAAQAAGKIWATWAPGTYSAFCRQYGNYSTRNKGWHDWNGEAMEKMVQQMAAPWHGLELLMRSQQRAIAQFIDSPTDSAATFLEDELGSNLVAPNPLRHALMTEQRSLSCRVEDVFAEADTQIKNLHTDGLSSLRTSFFGAAMESSYMACNRESGGGSHARRVAIMNRALSRESLFTDILDKMIDRFASLADSLQGDLTDAVNSYLASIHDTLDLVRNENTALESQSDLEFHGRVSVMVQKVKRGMQRIHERINEQTND